MQKTCRLFQYQEEQSLELNSKETITKCMLQSPIQIISSVQRGQSKQTECSTLSLDQLENNNQYSKQSQTYEKTDNVQQEEEEGEEYIHKKYFKFSKKCQKFIKPLINKNSDLKCKYCQKQYRDIYILRSHILRIHKIIPNECGKCGEKFYEMKALKLHIEAEHIRVKKTQTYYKKQKVEKHQNKGSRGDLRKDSQRLSINKRIGQEIIEEEKQLKKTIKINDNQITIDNIRSQISKLCSVKKDSSDNILLEKSQKFLQNKNISIVEDSSNTNTDFYSKIKASLEQLTPNNLLLKTCKYREIKDTNLRQQIVIEKQNSCSVVFQLQGPCKFQNPKQDICKN